MLGREALGAGLKKALGPEDPRMREMLDKLMAEDGLEMDDMTELMLRGEGAEMEMAIRGQGQGAGLERLMYFLQIGYFSTGRPSSAISPASCRCWKRRGSIPASSPASATTSTSAWKPSGA